MVRGRSAIEIFLLALGLLVAFSFSASAQTKRPAASSAQRPTSERSITVNSNLVLVPVFVYNEAVVAQPPKSEMECARATIAAFGKMLLSEPYLPKDCDAAEVHGLTSKDFRLFQDGVEQEIRSMTPGAWWTVVRDNLGWYMQSSYTPTGIWGTPDLNRFKIVPPGLNRDLHILAYVPSSPQPGCHHIKVEVDRPYARVFARSQYCTGQTPSDPLWGTRKGKQLQQDLASDKSAKLPLSLQATAFPAASNAARVDIALQFPWNRLFHWWSITDWTLHASIGVMGVAERKDGSVAARFSDLLYPSYWPTFVQGQANYMAWEMGTSELLNLGNPGAMRSGADAKVMNILTTAAASEIEPTHLPPGAFLSGSDPAWLPTRYETQFALPPGDYTLRVVLGDGQKFGRVETPLTIVSDEGKQIALSSVALCKRLRDASAAAPEAAKANFAPQYVPLESKGIWYTPAGDTSFTKSEPMFAYFEVYEPLAARHKSGPVEVSLRILDAATGKVAALFAPVNANEYESKGSTVIPIARKIPFAQLPKGAYRLEVQATDAAGESTPWRSAGFTIQ